MPPHDLHVVRMHRPVIAPIANQSAIGATYSSGVLACVVSTMLRASSSKATTDPGPGHAGSQTYEARRMISQVVAQADASAPALAGSVRNPLTRDSRLALVRGGMNRHTFRHRRCCRSCSSSHSRLADWPSATTMHVAL